MTEFHYLKISHGVDRCRRQELEDNLLPPHTHTHCEEALRYPLPSQILAPNPSDADHTPKIHLPFLHQPFIFPITFLINHDATTLLPELSVLLTVLKSSQSGVSEGGVGTGFARFLCGKYLAEKAMTSVVAVMPANIKGMMRRFFLIFIFRLIGCLSGRQRYSDRIDLKIV